MTPDASLPPADVQRPTDNDEWCACGHEWAEDHQVPASGGNFSSWCRICGVDCSASVQRPTPPLTWVCPRCNDQVPSPRKRCPSCGHAKPTSAPPLTEEFTRSVSHRCPIIGRHSQSGFKGCPCHPIIPMPCADCYAVEVFTRPVPWSELGRSPQPGAASDGSELP